MCDKREHADSFQSVYCRKLGISFKFLCSVFLFSLPFIVFLCFIKNGKRRGRKVQERRRKRAGQRRKKKREEGGGGLLIGIFSVVYSFLFSSSMKCFDKYRWARKRSAMKENSLIADCRSAHCWKNANDGGGEKKWRTSVWKSLTINGYRKNIFPNRW